MSDTLLFPIALKKPDTSLKNNLNEGLVLLRTKVSLLKVACVEVSTSTSCVQFANALAKISQRQDFQDSISLSLSDLFGFSLPKLWVFIKQEE